MAINSVWGLIQIPQTEKHRDEYEEVEIVRTDACGGMPDRFAGNQADANNPASSDRKMVGTMLQRVAISLRRSVNPTE